ncbi:MAG: NAD(P)H-flavin reductase [Pseudomonadales bacterium]
MEKVKCSIESVSKLNHDVYQVKLQMPEGCGAIGAYKSGQYLDLVVPGFHNASFSIASAPEAGRELELHIRHNPQSDISNAIIAHLEGESSIELELPKGEACLSAAELKPQTTLILAAASTGFSQVKSIVEHLLAADVKNPIHIYWGVRVASDLYWSLLAENWAQAHDNIVFHPVISDPTEQCEWTGRTDLLPDAILQDFEDFSDVTMMASGSPAMVYALLDACESKGFSEAHLLSDVLAYAPRPAKS